MAAIFHLCDGFFAVTEVIELGVGFGYAVQQSAPTYDIIILNYLDQV